MHEVPITFLAELDIAVWKKDKNMQSSHEGMGTALKKAKAAFDAASDDIKIINAGYTGDFSVYIPDLMAYTDRLAHSAKVKAYHDALLAGRDNAVAILGKKRAFSLTKQQEALLTKIKAAAQFASGCVAVGAMRAQLQERAKGLIDNYDARKSEILGIINAGIQTRQRALALLREQRDKTNALLQTIKKQTVRTKEELKLVKASIKKQKEEYESILPELLKSRNNSSLVDPAKLKAFLNDAGVMDLYNGKFKPFTENIKLSNEMRELLGQLDSWYEAQNAELAGGAKKYAKLLMVYKKAMDAARNDKSVPTAKAHEVKAGLDATSQAQLLERDISFCKIMRARMDGIEKIYGVIAVHAAEILRDADLKDTFVELDNQRIEYTNHWNEFRRVHEKSLKAQAAALAKKK